MVATLSMGWSDVSGLARMEEAVRNLAPGKFNPAAARALNRAGASGKTHAGRALVKQTGLKRRTIVAAMKPKRATSARLTYEIRARGGDISLKHFGARETRKGVSAAPFGKRQVFDGTFMKAAWFPNRVAKPNWNGQVFKRTGGQTSEGMDAFEKQKSGLYIPEEMIKDESAKAWQDTVGDVLPRRLGHELARLTGEAFTFGR